MPLHLLLIVVGFALLAKGADVLVAGASSLARRLHISDLAIGLTVVAFGTSAPELVVSVAAALRNSGGIALGNVLGSNIANLCLVLGVAGFLRPIEIRRGTLRGDMAFCIASAVLLALTIAFHNQPFLVGRVEGAVLLCVMAAYMAFSFSPRTRTRPIATETRPLRPVVALIMIVIGLAGLVGGGELIVRNAVKIAERLQVSSSLIGLTIVAFGTSLPELAIAVVSVFKGKNDIAVGNVIGSNIFNACLVLGTASVVRPLNSDAPFLTDAVILCGASVLLLVFIFNGKRRRIERWEALTFLGLYAAYMVFAIKRG